jgi:hypothetical protein
METSPYSSKAINNQVTAGKFPSCLTAVTRHIIGKHPAIIIQLMTQS